MILYLSYEVLMQLLIYLIVQIYVVDSLDRERIGRAKAEFQVVYLERYADFLC